MKDLQIDSTPLDLLQNSSYGVEASCKDIVSEILVIKFLFNNFIFVCPFEAEKIPCLTVHLSVQRC